jgi:BirA family biotin operon repressor/biotin-[acetyl-CoA-carboxylase] ligase
MRVFNFDSVSSTNDEAVRLLSKGVAPMFAVIANKQSHGRGYRGHSWISEDQENVYFSAALPVDVLSVGIISMFPQIFALNFIIKLERIKGARLNVKWPNDILLAGKKVGGVLLETCLGDGDIKYAVLGVGINVNSAPILGGESYEAMALVTYFPSISHAFVLDLVIESVESAVNLCKCGACGEFVATTWKKFDAFYGKRVRVEAEERIYCGHAFGVDFESKFVLYLDSGERMSFGSANTRIIQ